MSSGSGPLAPRAARQEEGITEMSQFDWTRRGRIEPLPLPYPWRRMAWAVFVTLVLLALSYIVVVI